MRYASRTDGNQPDIIHALKRIGASVYYMKQPLDLLVGYRGKNFILEVKMPREDLNGEQTNFCLRWCGSYHVVHTVEEAIAAVIGPEALK